MTREQTKEFVRQHQSLRDKADNWNWLIDHIFNEHEMEITLLKQCVEEAIKRPMGVEPIIYSDYKENYNEVPSM